MNSVLIVDDSKIARKILRSILEKLEFDLVYEAKDGGEGVEMFKVHQPDLVITDLEMPNFNGVEMIKQIRGHSDDTKVIVVTSVVNAQVIQEVQQLKASVVNKPVKNNRLAQAIKLLER